MRWAAETICDAKGTAIEFDMTYARIIALGSWGKLSWQFPHVDVRYVGRISKAANVGLPLGAAPLPCNNVRYRKRGAIPLTRKLSPHDDPHEFIVGPARERGRQLTSRKFPPVDVIDKKDNRARRLKLHSLHV